MPMRVGRRIPEPTVARLPVYHRVLLELARESVVTVSSAELAGACGVNAAKVRKDLSLFGSYGTPGTGYHVDYLLRQVQRELGLDRQRPVVMAGMGYLGHALARSPGFVAGGFQMVGLFDVDPQTIGELVGSATVRHISELAQICQEAGVSIGIITTPAPAAQDVCDVMTGSGVRAILNFAPAVLSAPPAVQVRHVDFSAELHVLAFYEAHPEAAPSPLRQEVIAAARSLRAARSSLPATPAGERSPVRSR
jgi:redox-sensing transcriptional repressor